MKKVIPPGRGVVIVESPPNKLVHSAVVRRIRLFCIRGPAPGRNSGTSGRAMGKPAQGKIAENEPCRCFPLKDAALVLIS